VPPAAERGERVRGSLARLLRTEAGNGLAGGSGGAGTRWDVAAGDQAPLGGGLELTVAVAPGQLDSDLGMDPDHDGFTSFLALAV
jgi:hypothetical protein